MRVCVWKAIVIWWWKQERRQRGHEHMTYHAHMVKPVEIRYQTLLHVLIMTHAMQRMLTTNLITQWSKQNKLCNNTHPTSEILTSIIATLTTWQHGIIKWLFWIDVYCEKIVRRSETNFQTKGQPQSCPACRAYAQELPHAPTPSHPIYTPASAPPAWRYQT